MLFFLYWPALLFTLSNAHPYNLPDLPVAELLEKPAETGVSKPKKGTGGRPKLDIAVAEVLDNISNGKTVSQTARAMGISRQAVYRAIYSSPTGILMWADGRGKGSRNVS